MEYCFVQESSTRPLAKRRYLKINKFQRRYMVLNTFYLPVLYQENSSSYTSEQAKCVCSKFKILKTIPHPDKRHSPHECKHWIFVSDRSDSIGTQIKMSPTTADSFNLNVTFPSWWQSHAIMYEQRCLPLQTLYRFTTRLFWIVKLNCSAGIFPFKMCSTHRNVSVQNNVLLGAVFNSPPCLVTPSAVLIAIEWALIYTILR